MILHVRNMNIILLICLMANKTRMFLGGQPFKPEAYVITNNNLQVLKSLRKHCISSFLNNNKKKPKKLLKNLTSFKRNVSYKDTRRRYSAIN